MIKNCLNNGIRNISIASFDQTSYEKLELKTFTAGKNEVKV